MYFVKIVRYAPKVNTRRELKVFHSSDFPTGVSGAKSEAEVWRSAHAPTARIEVCLVPLL